MTDAAVDLLRRIVSHVKLLSNRWPCPHCGRPSVNDKLVSVKIKKPGLDAEFVGCWYCNLEPLIEEAAELLRQAASKATPVRTVSGLVPVSLFPEDDLIGANDGTETISYEQTRLLVAKWLEWNEPTTERYRDEYGDPIVNWLEEECDISVSDLGELTVAQFRTALGRMNQIVGRR